MASQTQVNGFTAIDTDYFSGTTIRPFTIQVNGADSSWFDSEFGDEGIVEQILRVVQPIAHRVVKNGNNGIFFVWVEGAFVNAANLQTDIRALGATVGPNNIDLTSVTVVQKNLGGSNI